MHTHAHTQRYSHTQAFWLYKAKFTQLKMGSKQRLEMDEDSSMEQNTWQVYSFGRINVFRLHLNESREGFCRRGGGRSFHIDGPKTEKAWEPICLLGQKLSLTSSSPSLPIQCLTHHFLLFQILQFVAQFHPTPIFHNPPIHHTGSPFPHSSVVNEMEFNSVSSSPVSHEWSHLCI